MDGWTQSCMEKDYFGFLNISSKNLFFCRSRGKSWKCQRYHKGALEFHMGSHCQEKPAPLGVPTWAGALWQVPG